MFVKIRHFFAAPAFDDDKKNRVAGLLNILLLVVILLMIVRFTTTFFTPSSNKTVALIIYGVAIGCFVGMFFLIRTGYIKATSFIFTGFMWVAVTLVSIRFGGLLRQERRLLGWVVTVLGAVTLLRVVGPIEVVALSVYFVLAPICMAWIGVDVLVSGSKRQL